jgi:hypothetical protein
MPATGSQTRPLPDSERVRQRGSAASMRFSSWHTSGREVVRVLEPGALAVFTTWESPERLPDLAALFEAAGLEVVSVEERAGWADRQRTIYENALTDRPQYPDDRGLQNLAEEATMVLPKLAVMRRVIGTARGTHPPERTKRRG